MHTPERASPPSVHALRLIEHLIILPGASHVLEGLIERGLRKELILLASRTVLFLLLRRVVFLLRIRYVDADLRQYRVKRARGRLPGDPALLLANLHGCGHSSQRRSSAL